MKKISKISLIILFFTLILPNQSAFVSARFAPSSPKKFSKPALTVKVVEIKPNTQITIAGVSRPAVLSPACSGSYSEAGDLVQKTALLNLNQPVACFALQSPSLALAPFFAKLEVAALEQPGQNIVVAGNRPAIASPQLSQSPARQTFPILPSAGFALIFAVSLSLKKLAIRQLKFPTNIKILLTLARLQMFRC